MKKQGEICAVDEIKESCGDSKFQTIKIFTLNEEGEKN